VEKGKIAVNKKTPQKETQEAEQKTSFMITFNIT